MVRLRFFCTSISFGTLQYVPRIHDMLVYELFFSEFSFFNLWYQRSPKDLAEAPHYTLEDDEYHGAGEESMGIYGNPWESTAFKIRICRSMTSIPVFVKKRNGMIYSSFCLFKKKHILFWNDLPLTIERIDRFWPRLTSAARSTTVKLCSLAAPALKNVQH